MLLRRLLASDEQAFLTAYKEWETPELAKRWFSCWEPPMSFGDLRTKLLNDNKGINLPDGFVPSSTMYAFTSNAIHSDSVIVDSVIVGRLSIRHKLTDALQIFGGHIGYAVAPKYRHKGYASSMLEQALPICTWLGIKEALFTIDKLNYASIAVVKKCGGMLADEFWDASHHRTTQRWTIKT